jgi:hypothetical protein
MPTIEISQENYERLVSFGAHNEGAMTLDERLAFALDEAVEYEDVHGELPHDEAERTRVILARDANHPAGARLKGSNGEPTERKTAWERLDAIL